MPRIHTALRNSALVSGLLVAGATNAAAQLPGSILGPGTYNVSGAQISYAPFSLTGFYWHFDFFARPCAPGPSCSDVGIIGHNQGAPPAQLAIPAAGNMSFWAKMTFVFSTGPLSWSNSSDAPPTTFQAQIPYNGNFQSFFDVFINVDITQTGAGMYAVTAAFKGTSSAGGLRMEGTSSFQLTCTDCTTEEEGDDEITVTPEPISMALLGTGLLGMGGAKWRSRRRRDEIEVQS